MPTQRIYHVEMYRNGEEVVEHLVEAASKAAAARHIVEAYGTVHIASQRDIARLVGLGVPVETMGDSAPIAGE
jgi:hypothetical protein